MRDRLHSHRDHVDASQATLPTRLNTRESATYLRQAHHLLERFVAAKHHSADAGWRAFPLNTEGTCFETTLQIPKAPGMLRDARIIWHQDGGYGYDSSSAAVGAYIVANNSGLPNLPPTFAHQLHGNLGHVMIFVEGLTAKQADTLPSPAIQLFDGWIGHFDRSLKGPPNLSNIIIPGQLTLSPQEIWYRQWLLVCCSLRRILGNQATPCRPDSTTSV